MGKSRRRMGRGLRRDRMRDDPIRGASADRLTKVSRAPAKTEKERRTRRKLAQQRYRASPKGKYQNHKHHARTRGIGFELTFSQWLEIWEESGHWDERGNFADGYVMQRIGDQGPYAVGNVFIGRHVDNIAESNALYARRRAIRVDERDPDYAHVHSAPDIDSSWPVPGARDPVNFPEVPF